MPADDHDDPIEDTLADHELAVKRALESLGTLEDTFADAGADTADDEREHLEALGRAFEEHVQRLEALVQTLDEHKRAIHGESDEQGDALATALERARRRARQEPTPSGSTPDDESRDP